jgi:hypothetical protein
MQRNNCTSAQIIMNWQTSVTVSKHSVAWIALSATTVEVRSFNLCWCRPKWPISLHSLGIWWIFLFREGYTVEFLWTIDKLLRPLHLRQQIQKKHRLLTHNSSFQVVENNILKGVISPPCERILFTMKHLFRSYKNRTGSRLGVHAYSITNMADRITNFSLLCIWEKMQDRWEDTNTVCQALSAKGWRLYCHPLLLNCWSVLFNKAVNC